MKRLFKYLSLALAAIILLSAAGCGNKPFEHSTTSTSIQSGTDLNSRQSAAPVNGDSGTDSIMQPFAPYPETVTITTARQLNLGNELPEGVTTSDNIYIDVIRDKLNVQVVIAWETTPDDYMQKLELSIAGDTLPDVFLIPSSEYLTFKFLVKAGKLADLTDAYKNCIGGYDAMYLSYMDGSQNDLCLFDGRLMGIPQIPTGYNYNLLWVREDWLKKIGKPAPRTIDEIKEVALAFQDQKLGGENTRAIIVDPINILSHSGSFLSFSTIANALRAYPRTWIFGPDGKALYGSIAPEMKTVLAVLRDWYQAGIIDPQFMAYPNMDAVTPAMREGRVGMFFGAYWSPWVVDYGADTPEKSWIPVLGPVDQDGKFNHTNPKNPTGFLLVSNQCEYPEAAIKAVNVAFELERGAYNSDPAIKAEVDKLTTAGGRTVNPFPGSLSNLFDREARIGLLYKEYCETGVLNSLPGMSLESIQENAQKCLTWYCGDRVIRSEADKDNRIQYDSYMTIASLLEATNQHDEPVAFSETTESMGDYWPALDAMERKMVIQIISGEKPLDYFDEFVAEWKKSGGDIITAEVNEMICR